MDTAASVSGGFSFQSATTDAYAIPIDRALAVVRLIEKGTSTATVHVGATAFLGVEVTSPGRGFGYGSGSTAGALVAGVVPGSPADRAGLAYGDRIVAVDGTTTASPAKVVALLLRRHPGERVTLAWLDPFGARRSATVALAAGPAQ
jgi:S1-C subfamily serine protease